MDTVNIIFGNETIIGDEIWSFQNASEGYITALQLSPIGKLYMIIKAKEMPLMRLRQYFLTKGIRINI